MGMTIETRTVSTVKVVGHARTRKALSVEIGDGAGNRRIIWFSAAHQACTTEGAPIDFVYNHTGTGDGDPVQKAENWAADIYDTCVRWRDLNALQLRNFGPEIEVPREVVHTLELDTEWNFDECFMSLDMIEDMKRGVV